MIAIIDYGMGNLRSVQKAFEKNGAQAQVTSSTRDIDRAEKIVLPGVGAFEGAMEELKKRGLVDVIKEKISDGVPYLGLCLGLQLLFETSEESLGKEKARGLGVVPGTVRRFRGKFKIPHMGWNTLRIRKKNCPLFKGLGSGESFYFVHSYYGAPKDPSWT
ncbi:MAG: imidazole glycerol phosphate synthase subunit HisH, partial [Candidatus Omnitrophota bacterium]